MGSYSYAGLLFQSADDANRAAVEDWCQDASVVLETSRADIYTSFGDDLDSGKWTLPYPDAWENEDAYRVLNETIDDIIEEHSEGDVSRRIINESTSGSALASTEWIHANRRAGRLPPHLDVYLFKHNGHQHQVFQACLERLMETMGWEIGLEQVGRQLNLTLWQWELFHKGMSSVRNIPSRIPQMLAPWAFGEIPDIQEVTEAIEATNPGHKITNPARNLILITPPGDKGQQMFVWMYSGSATTTEYRPPGWFVGYTGSWLSATEAPCQYLHVNGITEALFGRVAP